MLERAVVHNGEFLLAHRGQAAAALAKRAIS